MNWLIVFLLAFVRKAQNFATLFLACLKAILWTLLAKLRICQKGTLSSIAANSAFSASPADAGDFAALAYSNDCGYGFAAQNAKSSDSRHCGVWGANCGLDLLSFSSERFSAFAIRNGENLSDSETRTQLRGGLAASVRASKIARVLQVLIFAVSCLFASQLPAQNLQTATQTIAPQAKNSQTATQEQNAKNSQNAAQSQNAQDLRVAPQAQEPQAQNEQDSQITVRAQAARDLTAPQEKKEEKMQKCDFYPVTDFFNLMEQLYNNLNKMCLLSRETANWEATGVLVVEKWWELKKEDVPADYPHHFYISGVAGERVRVRLLPHLLGKKTLIPDMKFPKNIPAPYALFPITGSGAFFFHFGSEYPKQLDLGLGFGEFQKQTAYYWAKLDGNSEMYQQTGQLSFMIIPVGRSAGYEFIDLLLAVPIRDIDEHIKYNEQFRPKF